jgi:hypothetical protein
MEIRCARTVQQRTPRPADRPRPFRVLDLLSADLAGQLRRLADMIGYDMTASEG